MQFDTAQLPDVNDSFSNALDRLNPLALCSYFDDPSAIELPRAILDGRCYTRLNADIV
jgi:hypothetical protein